MNKTSNILAGIALAWLCAGPALADRKAELKEEIDEHQTMAAAHRGAAACLQAGKPPEDCAKAMEAECKGVAAGPRCGMRLAREGREDRAAHQERHARMAAAHDAAAKCLAGGKAPEACEKRLRADCRGLSVNRHCGLRGHHH
ncbi:MAG: hypothetical protein ACOZDY_02650 [Pseudomonadota bacterium]